MSEHDTHCSTEACNTDSCSDAKAVIALVAIIVVTVCFWLIGQ